MPEDEITSRPAMMRDSSAFKNHVECLIESVLALGHFVSYKASFYFIRKLKDVEKQANLVRTSPDSAVSLYETFIAGCFEKADEIDDSSGSFGQFVAALFCGWSRGSLSALRRAGGPPA